MDEFKIKSNCRILNDGLVTIISGEDLESFALALEREVPEQCGWLRRSMKHKPKCHNLKIDPGLRCTPEMVDLCEKEDSVRCNGHGKIEPQETNTEN